MKLRSQQEVLGTRAFVYKRFLLKTDPSAELLTASQGRLQRRVQDVVLVAVAVGVAVVALRAGRRRRLLQTHQHVHLLTERET